MRQHTGKAASAEEKGREGGLNLRHISSSDTTSKLSQYHLQQHRQSSKLSQAAAGSKALELGGEPVSERGCLPTKLTDT